MLSALTTDDVALSKTLGVYSLPGVATAYPELASMVRIMYRDRFAALPFIPKDWFPQVNAVLGVGGKMILPVPAYDAFRRPSGGMPEWLDNDAKRNAWEDARNALKTGYMNFTQGKIEQGREELNKLYANIAFWKRLEDVAQYIADIPKKVAFAGLKVLWPWILIGGAVLFVLPWARRQLTKTKE